MLTRYPAPEPGGIIVGRPIKVLIVDDHFVVRRGTRALLVGDGAEDIEVVGEAEDGHQAIEMTHDIEPDVILMDLQMPGMNGVEAIYEITAERPASRIVAMTGSELDERVLRAVKAGARGFLSKTAHRDEFLEAIRQVHRGDVSLPPELTRKLLQQIGPSLGEKTGGETEALTNREVEILRLVARGLSNQDIAASIHIAEATVRTHVSHILAKLNLSNRVEAALYALRQGLASLE